MKRAGLDGPSDSTASMERTAGPTRLPASSLKETRLATKLGKYVVSGTRSGVEWDAGLVQGDLAQAVRYLKQEQGEGLWVGGVTFPLSLANLGLVDGFELVAQPVLAGHGSTLLAGLRESIPFELVDRLEFRSGAVAVRYRPTQASS